MAIKSLELRNFQSHENSVIVFDKNFNCIVGHSRAGKTSIVRAWGCIVNDEWHDVYLRKGASHVVVRVVLDNGYVIERQKGPDVNKIIVTYPDKTFKEFEKFGIEAPPEVKQILRIYPVKITADYEVNLNLSDQDAPPFLLSETGPMKTKYLNRLTGAHLVDNALRELNKDKLSTSSSIQKSQESIDQFTTKLGYFKNIDILKEKILTYHGNVSKVRTKIDYLTKIRQLRDSLVSIVQQENKIRKTLSWVNVSQNVIEHICSKYNKVKTLQQLAQVIKQIEGVQKVFQKVTQDEKDLLKDIKQCPFCGSNVDGQIFSST